MKDDLISAEAAGLMKPTRPTIAMTQSLPRAKNLEGVHKSSSPELKFLPNPINSGSNLTKPAESSPLPLNLILWITGIILALILLAILTAIIQQ